MELNRQHWNKNDLKKFYEYEKSLVGSDRDCIFEQRIVNTKLPCFGRTSTKAREVAKEIKKGNYVEFLNCIEFKSHFDTLVYAFLLNNFKNFALFQQYLINFAKKIDNWASCDTLRFRKFKSNELITLSDTLLKSDLPFVRRIGVNIFLDLIKDKSNLSSAFEMLDGLREEKEYYVNMSAAWVLSFCFIYNREETLTYFKRAKTNAFVINKAISKCRDSYRVSADDKELLKQFKV